MRTAREIIAECSPYASRDIADLGADALDGRASWDEFHRVLPARRARLSGCDNAVASAVASILHGGGRSVTEDAAGAVLRYANNAADDALRDIAERKPNRRQGTSMRTTRKPNPRAPGKTERIHVIQGNYGGQYGWEDQSAYPDTAEGRKSARADIKEYRASGQGSYRLIARRVMRDTQERYRAPRKPNGALSRSARACSARGSKLRLTGDPKAASRLSGLCRHGGRKRNGADEGPHGFEYVELDSNMAPHTAARLKKLLRERLPAAFPVSEYTGTDVSKVLHRRGIRPSGRDGHGRLTWLIPRARMLTLVPSLLRGRTDDEMHVGGLFAGQFDIGVL